MNRILRVVLLILGVNFTSFAADEPRTIEMKVDGLVCAFCAQGISKKLGKLDATADVLVSLENGIVAVALKPGRDVNDQDLRETLTDAGYSLRSVERTSVTLPEIRARLEKTP